MAHVKITSGSVDTYPYSIGQLRRDNPNTSFPRQIPDSILEEYGVYTVSMSDVPDIDARTQTVAQNATPSLVDGVWSIGWTVSSKTEEEVQEYDANMAEKSRFKRNDLLAQTDYFALTDVTMDAAMTSYRQALRDLPATIYIANPVLPDPPGGN